MTRPRIGFLMEQTLGHVAYSSSLKSGLSGREDIEVVWLPVPFHQPDVYECVPGFRSNWTLRGSVRARKILRSCHAKLDALFVHTPTIALLASSFLKRIPSVLSLDATPANIDSMAGGYRHSRQNQHIERIKRLLTARSLKSAGIVSCWSQWAAESAVSDYGVEHERIRVIPPGVDSSFWSRPTKALNTNVDSAVQLLFVGGDFERKGGNLLLDAYRGLDSSQFHLHLVTSAELPLWVSNHEYITVHRGIEPNSEGIRSLFHAADIFVLPTLADCLPIALLEALACGLPVIATQIGAIPEVIKSDSNGILIPPGDPGALQNAITTLAGSVQLREQMSLQNDSEARQQYDITLIAGTILAELSVMIRAGSR